MKLPKNYHPDFRIPGKKPVGAVEVDQLDKVKFLHLGNLDLASNTAPSYFSGATFSRNALDLSSEPSYATANVNATPDGYPCSVIIDITPLSSGSANRFFASSGYTAGYGGLWCQLGSGNEFTLLAGSGSAGPSGRRQWDGVGSFPVGRPMRIAATLLSNTLAYCFINGSEYLFNTSGTGSGIVDFGGSAQLGRIGYGDIPWLTTGQSELRLMCVVERGFSKTELKSLSENPYQILKPANPYGYFTAGSNSDIIVPPALPWAYDDFYRLLLAGNI